MKIPHLSVLALSLSLVLAACGGGATTPTDPGTSTPSVPTTTPSTPTTTPSVPTTPTTASLTITLSGVASAPVRVTDASGTVKFDGTVSGSQSLTGLPRSKYTVTAGAVTNYTAPAAQTADLSSGDSALTLTYTALPGTALDPNTVSGVIPNWNSGVASAALAHVYFTTSGLLSNVTGMVSPAGTVTSNGTLNISLPSTLDSSYIYPIFSTSCTFTGTATDPTFQSDWYGNRLIQAGDNPLGVAREFVSGSSSDNRHIVYRVYVPADTTVKGTESCNSSAMYAYTDTYDLKLSKGWNTVEGFRTGTPNTGSVYDNYTYQTLAAGARVELQYTSFTPGVQLALSDSSTLTLKRGDKATRNLKITQVGGYSGTISLGSSVAGVSVDPATVTLNPVTSQAIRALSAQAQSDPRARQRLEMAQALAPASVTSTLTFTASADAAPHDGASTDLLTAKDASGTTLGSTSLPITVSVPSVTGYLSNIYLDKGSTISTTAYVYSNNGYSGPVTVSLENLPDGVSAPSTQATVSGSNYVNVPLSFTASASATPVTKTAQLVINAGGVITRSDVTVTVAKPSVSVSVGSYSYSSFTVRRGQTQNLSVQVSSQHGFSGSTTISLTGLPSGVTASPLTVNVTSGATTNATLPITASDSAAYGYTSANVTGDDIGAAVPLSLAVASSVTAKPSESVRIATAGSGLWTISSSGQFVSSGNTYGYNYAVKRYEGNQLKLSTTVFAEGSSSSALLTTPTGDLVIPSGSRVYVVKADGTTSSVASDYTVSSGADVVDSLNRLWYTTSASSGSGGTLNTLDLSSGAKTVVSGITLSSSSASIYRNTAGSTLYLVPSSYYGDKTITQIDAATSTKTKDIPLPGISSVGSLAIAQDGTIWGGSSYASVFRVNADGTLTNFSSLQYASRLVFDAVSPSVLWSYASSAVYKIDTTTGTVTTIPTGSVSDIAADNAGGLWVNISDYANSVTQYYLSLVK